MKLVEAGMTNCCSSTALDKGLKPLAPHNPMTQESGFWGFDDNL